ncbi:MAG: leucine--tRNA ligase [Candidatus Paceibacterota bacterium]|jgi:leucyl-tRNA synthetase
MNYNHQKIEKKWQAYWEKNNFNRAEDFSKKPKYYCLVEFPYPSGDGLHMGHLRSYTAMDIVARKRRMEGFNVLFPIGWDAFGLPTENYAIKTGIHPKIVTKKNTDTFRKQLKSLGFSFDWDREIDTTDPQYYKWTQWIFLQLYKKGLAYKKKTTINWCPSCKIGLANEEAVGGKCERCGTPVEKKEKEQWILKITEYAEKLLKDLNLVDYWEKIKIQQANWIGKSEGASIDFKIQGSSFKIQVFTTRPDTLYGCTYMVLSPEHELVQNLKSEISNFSEVEKYINEAKNKSDLQRTEEKEKTGVELKGIKAINPVNGKEIPIFAADYVLSSYGTGAIMAVPAHDQRDFDFARKFGLEIIQVIASKSGEKADISKKAFEEEGTTMNSEEFDGMDNRKAGELIVGKIGAKKTVNYKLRDWIFSRQHYWGEPIPIVFCEKCGEVPVDEKDLPVKLPEVKKYEPTDTGESPLAAIKEWVNTKCPKCGGPAKRETDTMPNWAGSSWYFLRYIDPKNDKSFADFKKLEYWTPVDWYNGGMEHTTLHLLYSRFWNKFLYDIGVVPTTEPYKKRTSQGMILGEGGEKMSKSRGNVVNPDDLVKEFGTDATRVYEMFIGPFDQAIAWDPHGIEGASRFLNKVWNISQEKKISEDVNNEEIEKEINKAIKKVGEDIEMMRFNTAVSTLMIFINKCYELEEIPLSVWKKFLIILAPFAPHISEELWQIIGDEKESVSKQNWPKYDEKLIKEDNFDLIIQVNGKLRHKITTSKNISQKEAEELALAEEKIKNLVRGQSIKKIIFVKDKLINIVL